MERGDSSKPRADQVERIGIALADLDAYEVDLTDYH